MIRALSLVIIFCGCRMANAATAIPGRYGPEFTFTNSRAFVKEQEIESLIIRLTSHLIDDQPEGAKFTRDVDTFYSPNGWSFTITTNPGVFEVQMSPLTVEEFKRYAADIQDAIFVSAANEGMFPWLYAGGGHINIGMEIFGDNFLLARNFIVDFWNHNELAMGMFGYDTHNAIPFALMNPTVQAQVRRLLEKADHGGYSNDAFGIDVFATHVRRHTEDTPDTFGMIWDRANRNRYVDINLGHIDHRVATSRMEVRSVRPQPNIETWIRQIELLDSRINNYLRPLHVPLKLKLKVPIESPLDLRLVPGHDEIGHVLNPPLSPQKALMAFYHYVTESGLQWQDHRDYLWPKWGQEILKLEGSSEFAAAERHRCENLLRK